MEVYWSIVDGHSVSRQSEYVPIYSHLKHPSSYQFYILQRTADIKPSPGQIQKDVVKIFYTATVQPQLIIGNICCEALSQPGQVPLSYRYRIQTSWKTKRCEVCGGGRFVSYSLGEVCVSSPSLYNAYISWKAKSPMRLMAIGVIWWPDTVEQSTAQCALKLC